tara:strand:+ start:785 stop:1375 length:591 start_codon:yes stop_codon:yes gene_type:complete
MRKKEKKIQIFLISIGLLLILITYFYYPYMKSNRFIEDKIVKENLNNKSDNNLDSTFQNVSYKGFYQLDKTFTVKAEDAFILNEEPNVVHMKKMHVTLYLEDGRKVVITSNGGKYNKVTHDCFFEKNVKATEGKTEIFSDNLDLLATESLVKIYNNVSLSDITGLLYADEISYDFQTKYFKASMFDNKDVKIKMIK